MELKFDENKEITDFEIVNVEIISIQKIREEAQEIDDHYYRRYSEKFDYYNQDCEEESLYFRKLLWDRYGF